MDFAGMKNKMIENRIKELSKLSDARLIEAIAKYFKKHMTMPGEKEVKDQITALKKELDEQFDIGLLPEVRKNLINTFASVCVKEVKLKNIVVANQTEENIVTGKTTPDILFLDQIGEKATPGSDIVIRIYKMDVKVTDCVDKDNLFQVEDASGYAVGSLPENFYKNHNIHTGMRGIVVMTDYSNGKFTNMGYQTLIDLGQDIMTN